MNDIEDFKKVFANRREWGSYVAALAEAASYPRVIQAVRSGRAWFSESAFQASSWLVGTSECAKVASR